MKIAFVYATVAFGAHREPFDFSDLEGHKSGLTGTDLIALCYARELAARGHEVVFYCHGVGERTSFGDSNDHRVEVRDFKYWGDVGYSERMGEWDAVIATSNPNCLQHANPKALRVVNRQVSVFGIDTHEYETHGYDAFVDLYLVPSETSKRYVTAGLPASVAAKFSVLPNGCYPEQFATNAYKISDEPRIDIGIHPRLEPKVPGRVAYTSSPDRGLHLLLQAWPEIRRRVPTANLRIYYQSLDSWIAHHCDPAKRFGGPVDHECTRRALYVRNALRKLEGHGVTRVGGVSHRQLVKELCEAECFAYPCSPLAFTETFSVATLEACAAGAVPVISSADCLEEVHGHAAAVVRAPVQERMGEFADLVVRALTEPGFRREFAALGREHARAHDWRTLAAQLEQMIEDGIVKKNAPVAEVPDDVWTRPVGDTRSLERPRVDLVLTPYGSGAEPIDIDRPFDSNSGGGCRAGFMGLVRELPKLGYDVRAYSTFAGLLPRHDRKSEPSYHLITDFDPKSKRDVLVAYYDTSPLVGVTDCLRVASHHTFAIPCPGAFEWTDVNLAPSQYAVDALRPVFDTSSPWYVMPNGLQPDLPKHDPIPGRCIYHTSPSRGLHHLLEAWPEIRRQRPGATLHVVGDVAGWLAHYEGVKNKQGIAAARVKAAIKRLGDTGVKFLGRLTRRDMLSELASAVMFPFPFDAPAGPCETFSVSVAECLAIGVNVVTMGGDALQSLYGGSTTGAWVSTDLESWRFGVLDLLGSGGQTHSSIGRDFAKQFTFANKAAALDRAIRENLPGARRTEPGFRPNGSNVIGGPRGIPLPRTSA